jgi:hypothetical protein
MNKKSTPIKGRLLEFIEKTGLTNREFYRKTQFPNGFLNKVENFGSDKLEIIRRTFPFLNIIWLLSGEGEMYNTNLPQEQSAGAKPKNSLFEPNGFLDEAVLNDNLHEIDNLPISDAEKINLYKRVINSKNLLIKKFIHEVDILQRLLNTTDRPKAL